ncbi:MAG: YkgJ family cysteine cluster protein [Bacillota bacterium]
MKVQQERLVVFTKQINGLTGLDLCILDEEATVADLVDALAPMSEDPTVHKSYHPQHRGSCCGCKDNCCTHSLIAPDLKSLSSLAALKGYALDEIVQQTCEPQARKRGYLVLRSFPCLFLDNDRCTIYPYRPLICRLFICTQLTDAFQELIFRVLGRGISELHAALLKQETVLPWQPLPDIGGDREADYRAEFARFYRRSVQQSAFTLEEPGAYHRWKLRDLCDDAQWRILTRLV